MTLDRTRLPFAILMISMAVLDIGIGRCFAQASSSVTGVATDSSGAVVPGAKVVLTNMNTQETRTASAGSDGRYTFSLLIPGTYELVVEAAGFKKVVRPNINLVGAQSGEVNVALEPGAVQEVVEVSGSVVSLDTQSANQSTSLDAQQIKELPLNYRNPLLFVYDLAGVKSMISYTGIRSPQDTFLDGDVGLFAMNGGREGSNTVWVDGITAKFGDWGQTGATPQVDAVQEVQVARNTYDSQFDRVGNGVVNLITKGGSEQWHGGLFEYIRNSVLDANRWEFNKAGLPKEPLKRNQFGGSVSGPIWKSRRLYFLFGNEYSRLHETSSDNVTVPTLLQRQGNFSQTYNANGTLQTIYDPATTVPNPAGSGNVRLPFAGNIIPANRIDPVGLGVANVLFPKPTSAGTGVTGGLNFFGASLHAEDVNRFDGRTDWAVNDKDSMFLHITRNNFDEIQPRIFHTGVEDSNVSPHGGDRGGPNYQITLSNTYVPSGSWVLNLVVGAGGIASYSRGTSVADKVPMTAIGYSQAFASQFPLQSVGAWNIANYVSLAGGGDTLGHSRVNNLAANVTHEHGAHSIKFGFSGTEYLITTSKTFSTLSMAFNPGPTTGPLAASASSTSGNSIAALLLGVGTGSTTTAFKPAASEEAFGWYVQDAWKVTNRLTVTAGIRYELQLPWTERYNQLNHFDPNIANPLGAQVGLPLKGGLVYATSSDRGQTLTDFHNFAPRLGIAYKITDRLVMRTGYGISYSRSLIDGFTGTQGYTATTQWITTPNGLTPTVFASNPFPQGLSQPTGNSLGALSFVGLSPTAWNQNNPTPYVQSYSMDFQYQLAKGSVLEVGYTGNVGRRLAYGVTSNWDQLNPSYLSLGQALNNQVANPFYGYIKTGALSNPTVPYYQLLLPYPEFTGLSGPYSTKGTSSNFNALTAKFTHRFSAGLTLITTYQWSKALDNASEDQGWWLADGRRDVYNMNADYSISGHDVPQDLVNTFVYQLPVGKGRKFGSGMGKLPDALVGGWEFSGVIRFASGTPLLLAAQNTLSAYGFGIQHPNVANVGAVALSNPTPSEWFNVNAVTQPGTFQIGNAPRFFPNVRQDFMKNADLSLMKNFSITERIKMQFKVQAFNALNHPLFGIPSGNSGGPSPQLTLGSPSFGQVTTTLVTGSRQLSFGLKMSF